MDNNNKEIWKYFRVGDIVVEKPGSCWGNTPFVITGFGGNAYCPMVYMLQYGQEDLFKYRCITTIPWIRLIDAEKRPYISLPKASLIKIMNKENEEARREFMIRLNTNRL